MSVSTDFIAILAKPNYFKTADDVH